MARLLIQSLATGMFLVPDLFDGQPVWVGHLREAGGGVVADAETAHQLVAEWCEPEDQPCLVDLDRLGTADDYPVDGRDGGDHGTAAGPGLGRDGAALSPIPVGNHGDNNLSGATHVRT